MIHRRILSLVAIFLAVGAVACGGEPDTDSQTAVNAQTSALSQQGVSRTCKPPVATTVGFRCPQAGCCLQKSNATSPPTYFCYDCL